MEPWTSHVCTTLGHCGSPCRTPHITRSLAVCRSHRYRPSQCHDPSDTGLPFTPHPRIKGQLANREPWLPHSKGLYPLRITLCTLIQESLPCPTGITYPTPWRTGNGPAISTLTTSRSRQPLLSGRNVSKPSAIKSNMLVIKQTSVRAEASCKTCPFAHISPALSISLSYPLISKGKYLSVPHERLR
jgi:hypothetical protein